MAQVKPLTLKVAKATSKPGIVSENPFVEVLVKIPFFALEEIYTYLLPIGCEETTIGDLVSVEFGNHITEGVVIARTGVSQEAGNLKAIKKKISKIPVFSHDQIALARRLAKSYVTSAWSLLESFAPDFSATGEKVHLHQNVGSEVKDQTTQILNLPDPLLRRLTQDHHIRDLLVLPTQQPSFPIIASICRARSDRGKIVVVLADEKDLLGLSKELLKYAIPHTSLHSHLKKSERYSAYLQANASNAGIYLTLRNGVFLRATIHDTFIIVNDVEEHHYQRNAPTWNSREIALSRSDEVSVVFVSHSPSLEVLKETEEGRFTRYVFKQGPIRNLRFANADGSEGNYRGLVSEGLKRGNVLISVARSGYINSLSCRKCKNIAECDCGGKLFQSSSTEHPQCGICNQSYMTWKCPWCSSTQMNALSRGAIRSAAEYAKAYPGYQVLYSSGEEQLREIEGSKILVIATPGSEPVGDYAAIIILDAAIAYSHIDLRSQERVRLLWFSMLSKLSQDGAAYIGLPPQLEVSQGLLRSDAYGLALRELHERSRVQLPPSFRLVTLVGNHSDLSATASLFTSKGFSSFPVDGKRIDRSKLLVKIPSSNALAFIELLHSIQRIRALKKEEPFGIAFDPYSP